MKINYPNHIEKRFRDLKPGETFTAEDEVVCMKTKMVVLGNGCSINAVTLTDGLFTHISDLEMVTPINAELNIKGE